jgi:2-keto-3-deoxy-L-rhamnonate aldolase RhmA
MKQLDAQGSTVFLMIETQECLQNIDQIASVPGVDVLLVGANDLSLELGILGQWDHPKFRGALENISNAAKRQKKIFGLAGLYTRPDICKWAINELGVRYILGNLDIGLLATAARENVKSLKELVN